MGVSCDIEFIKRLKLDNYVEKSDNDTKQANESRGRKVITQKCPYRAVHIFFHFPDFQNEEQDMNTYYKKRITNNEDEVWKKNLK